MQERSETDSLAAADGWNPSWFLATAAAYKRILDSAGRARTRMRSNVVADHWILASNALFTETIVQARQEAEAIG